MSRIGRKPVAIRSGVTVSVTGSTVSVKGVKGEMKYTFLPEVTVKVEGSQVIVERKEDSDTASARQGLTRQLVENMVCGVSEGYKKILEVIGVGYKAQVQGKKLILNLGFSHPVEFAIPEGIQITQDEKNKNLLTVQGIDRQLVGQVAADIRSYRVPEPYKGKGIRYSTETVRRKPGKAAVGKGAPAA
ncbi:MAG TPA: 50S ribosomal protein L6 [Candidatus Peribacter riflensis]|uniref:Large ribosomal subunit protein uL6 n=1 Tax=Candidatus Peribacter riflensis TaxID=1735162 RepID=A0A0S1SHM7_9BACT|nr:MAG: large subunit ribosomal protein L6 [Candidatus Peribacter riflensis]OGJ82925.1 MAG: 50S ribosomal protein L6 [Candidatus Peribacteria bacterium RIFOXYC1_FULL_58_8]ALM10521.1 MAG: large subunit ribosomal protein L6 [Candidatus Peribacter riflensis]ALM11624.1 MAG: large subunit ribosomal protein L6 [Candidatus Peribacter riflensis]ALM12726.1 MAG: large subunit ribosomal protein L6 [Candidatus Peribacter riflensis]